ncbi:16S rRNA (adenine(1518)-N(6)/adenine(1519)-N(6))-dimethyltransferase RsmA [candidate division KSB1 bacterium]
MNVLWKKRYGQHLLHDTNIIRKFVSALDLTEGKPVIEIGPGSGALTKFLINEKADVSVIEIDEQFHDILEDEYSEYDNFKLIKGDILKISFDDMIRKDQKVTVTGNLPYNITSQIFFHLFNWSERISKMVFTIQKEVAQRVVSPVRSKNRSILSVLCQFYSEPEILFPVSRNCFFPKPKVDSAVVLFTIRQNKHDVNTEKFLKIVKTCFGKRRKTINNTLSQIEGIDLENISKVIDLNKRPEELEIEDFLRITRNAFSG